MSSYIYYQCLTTISVAHHRHLSSNIKVRSFGVIIIYEIFMPITSSVVSVSKPLRHAG